MGMIKYSVAVLLIFVAAARAQTATPEIADPTLGDIAMVYPSSHSPTGAVIYYNPILCRDIGAACLFFRTHEHGHVALSHHKIHDLSPYEREVQADEFAAWKAPTASVIAAWRLFRSGRGSAAWEIYGAPEDRALRICRAAQSAGNWPDDQAC